MRPPRYAPPLSFLCGHRSAVRCRAHHNLFSHAEYVPTLTGTVPDALKTDWVKRPGGSEHWPFDVESSTRVTCDVCYLCANFGLLSPPSSRHRRNVATIFCTLGSTVDIIKHVKYEVIRLRDFAALLRAKMNLHNWHGASPYLQYTHKRATLRYYFGLEHVVTSKMIFAGTLTRPPEPYKGNTDDESTASAVEQ